MRLAPVPLFYSRQIEDAIYFSGQSSIATHAAPNAIDACRYYASLIVGAIDGQNKADLLADTYLADYWRSESLSAEIEQVRLGSFKTKQPPQIVGSGYVVESLEAALWAFEHSDSFEQGTLMAVNLGDDADTTGAIYGQLAGAYYGETGIPAHWRQQLAFKPQMETMADQLYHLAWSEQ
jgi:ADP-ribosylglycohydrolase